MKYNRFLPLAIPLIVFLLSEIFFYKPKLIFVIIVLIFIIFLFTIRQFILANKSNQKFWNLLILPFCFSISLIIFTTIIPNKFIIQILFILNSIFLYNYFSAIYYLLVNSNNFKKENLRNLSSYGNFLAYFFFSSSIYGFQVFLNIQVWILMLIVIIFTALIVYQVIWANEISLKISLFYIALICLVLTEIAWSVSFLSLNYYILGLIVSICYYIIIGLTRFFLQDILNKKLIKQYLIFGFLSILSVLFTARWI